MSTILSRILSPFDLRKTRDPNVTRLIYTLSILVVLLLLFKFDSFGQQTTWVSMGVQFPEFGIMAIGVMLSMITGGIDLSVVGIANMSSICAVLLLGTLAPAGDANVGHILLAVCLAIIVGALAGLLNGLLIAMVRIPPILTTLGTLEFFTGIGILLTGGKALSRLPPAYGSIFGARLGDAVPVQLLIFSATAVFVGLLLHKTAFGEKLFMLGTNPTAAKFTGLSNASLLTRTYLVSGVCASLAGVVMLANYNSAKADYGLAYTLLTVLVVVLGGVNPNGGRGSIMGVVLATLILQVLSSGLNAFPEISNFYRPLIYGSILLVIVWIGDRGSFERIRKVL